MGPDAACFPKEEGIDTEGQDDPQRQRWQPAVYQTAEPRAGGPDEEDAGGQTDDGQCQEQRRLPSGGDSDRRGEGVVRQDGHVVDASDSADAEERQKE